MPRTRPRELTEEQELLLRHRAKDALRKQMKSVRGALPRAARAARADKAAARVTSLEAYRDARTVLGFVAVQAEMDPGPLLRAAHDAGKQLCLPRVDFDAMALRLHRFAPDDPLEPGGYGIPEPAPDAPEVPPDAVDLVLVPALAVDLRGHRIGYGKGFYDQLLPTLPRAVRCAYVYDFQILAEVPSTRGDEPVHVIATDSRVIMVP